MTIIFNRAWISLGLFFTLISCQNSEPQLVKIAGKTMGTTYNISYTPFTSGASQAAEVQKEVYIILERVNDLMSTYRPKSQLSQFNSLKSTESFKIDREFFKVVELAQKISEQSGGAFDITVGPIVNLWGFGTTNKKQVPTVADLTVWQKKIGYKKLILDAKLVSIRKQHAEMYVDLSAIAKGYGVDAVAAYLESIQALNYMVEIGGELRVKGLKNGKRWKIGITSPNNLGDGVQKIIELNGQALATSGDYRNFFNQNGKRYSHTIDPRTLRPVVHSLASVTVITERNCAKADALATTLMVLGPEVGLEFANTHNIKAYFIYRDKEQFKELYSAKILPLLGK